jgi:hypothetical protein
VRSGLLDLHRWRGSIGPSGASALAIGIGILFRVAEYVDNRQLWLDERALRSNVSGKALFDLVGPLTEGQMAPPGFLVIARGWVRMSGDSSMAIRLIVLLCAIASVFAFGVVARRFVSRLAVPIALAFLAVSDDLIYYATEFKQYSSDMLIAIGVLGMGRALSGEGWSSRRAVLAGMMGLAATWISHPSVFVLAGVSAVLGLDAIGRRDWKRLAAVLGLGAVWGLGFWGCYAVSNRMMPPEGREFLFTWWNFAFLPIPPESFAEASRAFWQVLNIFSNPVGLVSPIDPRGTALLGMTLVLIGSGALMARGWREALLLLLPIVLTVAASALGRYPFHGRLLVFLVPCIVLPMAEGIAVIGRRCGRVVLLGLLAFLLALPTMEAIGHILVQSRYRVFDSHGDQRNDLLDYLELIESRKARR